MMEQDAASKWEAMFTWYWRCRLRCARAAAERCLCQCSKAVVCASHLAPAPAAGCSKRWHTGRERPPAALGAACPPEPQGQGQRRELGTPSLCMVMCARRGVPAPIPLTAPLRSLTRHAYRPRSSSAPHQPTWRNRSKGRLSEGVPVRKMARRAVPARRPTTSVCCASGGTLEVRRVWLSAARDKSIGSI